MMSGMKFGYVLNFLRKADDIECHFVELHEEPDADVR